jgi:hypothetical protein
MIRDYPRLPVRLWYCRIFLRIGFLCGDESGGLKVVAVLWGASFQPM